MKSVASLFGLRPLAMILGGTLLLGGYTAAGNAAYQASISTQPIGAQMIVQAALNILNHMSGPLVANYNTNDGKASLYPGFDQQKLLQFWQQNNVSLNDVQSDQFAAAAFDIAGHPITHPPAVAADYWNNAGNAFPTADWQRIPAANSMPAPGDLAIFSGGTTRYGLAAIVVAVNASTDGQTNGSIVFAQTNFAPNYYTLDLQRSTWQGAQQSNPASSVTAKDIALYVAPLLPDGTVNGAPGYTLLGYLRNTAAQEPTPSLVRYTGTASKLPNSPWVPVAEADASANGLDPILFARQINQESGFNTTIVSKANAIGIAQFIPSTAASMGVDPLNPASALAGAARMMANAYHKFLPSSSSPQEAYEKALADYNCGCTQSVVAHYGSAWIDHLPLESRNYIRAIMGI